VRALVGLALLAASAAFAQDAERGRLLYETHCTACHYERVHKRDPAKSLVKDYRGLQAEVAKRAELTPRRFSIEELEAVAEYLNRSHYRFER